MFILQSLLFLLVAVSAKLDFGKTPDTVSTGFIRPKTESEISIQDRHPTRNSYSLLFSKQLLTPHLLSFVY